MDGTGTPRINRNGFVVGDQKMRLVIPLSTAHAVLRKGVSLPRAELLSALANLLEQRRLIAHHGVLLFIEQRLAAIPALVAGSRQQIVPFLPYGLIFNKTWLMRQGGRPVMDPDETPAHERTRSQLTSAEPGRTWAWHGQALEFHPLQATVFVPDAVAKAALMTCGFGGWKLEAITDYARLRGTLTKPTH